jgi:hypothetical protein
VGKAMSSNESAAYEIMRSLDVDYVLAIFGGVIGYSGDDINKFLWMVRIAEGEHPKEIRVLVPIAHCIHCPMRFSGEQLFHGIGGIQCGQWSLGNHAQLCDVQVVLLSIRRDSGEWIITCMYVCLCVRCRWADINNQQALIALAIM